MVNTTQKKRICQTHHQNLFKSFITYTVQILKATTSMEFSILTQPNCLGKIFFQFIFMYLESSILFSINIYNITS